MKKLLLFLFLISGFVTAQNTVGTISVTNEAYDGLTLFSVNTKTFLLDNCGRVVNEWNSSYIPGHSVYILPNGNLIRAGRKDTSSIGFGGVGGIVEMFDWDGNLIWEFDYSTDDHRLHHDIYPMPNGNILMLAATRVTNADAIADGRDPALLTEGDVYNERIFEVEPLANNGFNVVWEWNIMDHIVQDFDATKNNFGVIVDNSHKLDFNFINGNDRGANWLHINSIQYNEDLDQIVISSRNLSEFWVIDHSTTTAEAATDSGGTYGRGGDFLYRWGNPQAYDRGTESNRVLYGQHYPHIIPSGLQDAGKIIVFNNGSGRSPAYSEVMIIDPPTTSPGFYEYTPGQAYGPASPDYLYDERNEFYSPILSSAQRLPNGNILVCEGAEGHFFELNSSDEVVWDYFLPMNNNDGTITAQGDPRPSNGNTTFRGIKYARGYAGFTGRDLTPGDPIETNFNNNACQSLSTDDQSITEFKVYPNPTDFEVNIQSTSTINRLELYNVLGKRIAMKTASNSMNLSEYPSGVYILKIFSENTVQSQKVIKR